MPSSKPEQGQSLADLYPDVAKEWHPTLNGNLKPTDVRPKSGKLVWWRCSKGHEWQARICHRTYDRCRCPQCSGKLVIKGENDLQTTHPEIAKEWHPTKNGDLKPTDVRHGSSKRVWWKCSRGHEWKAMIHYRTYGNSGCPYCVANGTSYGEQFIYWSFKQLYPDNTVNRFKTSNKVEYDIYIPSIRLAIEYSGEFWHSNSIDKDIHKKQLAEKSNVRFIDIIEDIKLVDMIVEHNHFEYNSRNNQDDSLICIVTAIIQQYGHSASEIDFDLVKQQATEYSKGKIEYEKSLEYTHPNIAKEWHPTLNGDLKPTDITHGSNKKVWWKCSVCGHEWQAIVVHRVDGRGCKKCKERLKSSNGKVYETSEDLEEALN